MLSPDSELSQVGSTSKIPYWQRYYKYKKLLSVYANSPKIENIFRYWNSVVFAGMEIAVESRTSVVSKDQQSLNNFLLDIDEDPADDGSDPETVDEEMLTLQRQGKRVMFADTVQDIGNLALEDPKGSIEGTHTRDLHVV